MGEMLRRSFGIILLAGAFLVAGLAGIAGFGMAWPRTSNTSPLAALFALMWSCTYVVTAILTWRRSRLAAPAFLAAIGLLVFPASFIVPGASSFSLRSWLSFLSLSSATGISGGHVRPPPNHLFKHFFPACVERGRHTWRDVELRNEIHGLIVRGQFRS